MGPGPYDVINLTGRIHITFSFVFRYSSGMLVFLQSHSGSFQGSLTGVLSLFRYSSGTLPVFFRCAGLFDISCLVCVWKCRVPGGSLEPHSETRNGPWASNALNGTETFRSASGFTHLQPHCQFPGPCQSSRRPPQGPPRIVLTETYNGGFQGPLNRSHVSFRYSSSILPVFFRYAGKTNSAKRSNVTCQGRMPYRVFFTSSCVVYRVRAFRGFRVKI